MCEDGDSVCQSTYIVIAPLSLSLSLSLSLPLSLSPSLSFDIQAQSRKYNADIEVYTLRYAMVEQLRNPPKGI